MREESVGILPLFVIFALLSTFFHMKRISCVILILILLLPSYIALGQRNLFRNSVSLSELKTVLVPSQAWVPYPEYADREGWDRLFGDWKHAAVINADGYLDYEWKVVPASAYLEFARSGNRTVMQRPYKQNRQALTALVLGELAEGKGRFIDKIIDGAFVLCDMTSWAESAHIIFQPSGSPLPEKSLYVFDLSAGETGVLLAWTEHFFREQFDAVNPYVSQRIRSEVKTRIMDVYMDGPKQKWMALDDKPEGMAVNNWNPWCNSNALMCFMLLENDMDRYAEAVWRTMKSVDVFFNFAKTDGACEEGPSYWGLAAGKLFDYTSMLSLATASKVNLLGDPLLKNMGEYISRSYIGDGWCVNFADASAQFRDTGYEIWRYGKAVGSKEMMGFAAFLHRRHGQGLCMEGTDSFRTLENIRMHKDLEAEPALHETPAYTWYNGTEFCYMHDRKHGLSLACKGGYNAESHNHNDVGTFIFYKNNVPIFIDAGVGTYTRQTFSKERYSIWTMQSDWHNLPKINNVSQKYGKEYKASGTEFSPVTMTFSTNIAKAYPAEAAVDEWVRSYRLSRGELKISDSFRLKETRYVNQISFLTWGHVDPSRAGVVSINVKGQCARLYYDRSWFTCEVETIELDDPRLSSVWGNKLYRITLMAKTLPASGKYTFTIK